MAEAKIEEVTKDIEEIKTLIEQAKRIRVVGCLNIELRRYETELQTLNAKIPANPSEGTALPDAKVVTAKKRYTTELENFAWDQSEKFVKIFISLDCANTVPPDDVKATFTENSVDLSVTGLNDKDYLFQLTNLLEPIVVESSYHKVKSDMIVLYMKKAKIGRKWSCLTVTAKRLNDLKNKKMDERMEGVGDNKDPGNGIMNVLREMYASGDDEMKRFIAKSWTEGQEKASPEK